jgi:prophage DNA circulation protein
MAVFSLSFTRHGNVVNPIAEKNHASALRSSATTATAAASSRFARVFSVAGQVARVATSAATKAASAVSTIAAVKATVASDASFSKKVSSVLSGIDTLLTDQLGLSNTFVDLLAYDFGISEGSRLPTIFDFRELVSLFDFGSSDVDPVGTTSAVIQEKTNQDAINSLVRQASTILAARTIADLSFSSADDARSSLTTVADNIDLLCETMDDDTLYAALQDLRSSAVMSIDSISLRLPRLQSYTPCKTLPSLVVAHTLYGSIDRETDIIARNRIVNPMFVPGGVPMEVLSND